MKLWLAESLEKENSEKPELTEAPHRWREVIVKGLGEYL